MQNFFKKTFALTDKGAGDLVKASILTAVCNVILMFLSLIIFWFLKDSVVVLDGNTPTFNLVKYIGTSIILFLGVVISYYFQYNACFFSAYDESANKRISIAETLRKLPLSFFGRKDLTDITTTIMDDTAMTEEGFSHFIPELFGSVFSTIFIGIGLICYNFKMAIAVLWVVPVSFILCYCSKKIQYSYGRKMKANQLSYLEKTQECIENIKDIKANNRKLAHIKVMKEKLTNYEKSSVKGEILAGIFVTSAQMILKIGIATAMLVGISMLITGEIDILVFLVFMMVATRIFDPLSGSLINLAAIFVTLLSTERMKELERTQIQDGKKIINNKGYDIVFNNVFFAYNNDETVLKGVSFTAKQGEITALVGPSGGGKSTAIKLAARFWDSNKGEITLGGEDITKIEPEELLKLYSIVFQDVTLFNNTVMENIRIGKMGATDEEIIEIAKTANCHEFIMEMKDGYHTMIGENGSKLSGGERQRLSIARALLKDAPIVLLDEATSSLDIKNETAVQEAISRLTKNKTVIVIAHRMRTIMGANTIVLLKDGIVAQMGSHKELIDKDGDYKKMINLQIESLNWKLN